MKTLLKLKCRSSMELVWSRLKQLKVRARATWQVYKGLDISGPSFHRTPQLGDLSKPSAHRNASGPRQLLRQVIANDIQLPRAEAAVCSARDLWFNAASLSSLGKFVVQLSKDWTRRWISESCATNLGKLVDFWIRSYAVGWLELRSRRVFWGLSSMIIDGLCKAALLRSSLLDLQTVQELKSSDFSRT